MKEQQVPKKAFSFVEPEASVQFEDVEGKKTCLIVGYSGGVIKNHWYWGNLAIDLEGMVAEKKFYPVLDSHNSFDMDKIIGYSPKPDIATRKLLIEHIKFMDTPSATGFVKMSQDGFPFEASIQGRPHVIERLEEGESVMVNGNKLVGPGSVWRKWTYKETSVCVFGADSNTKSKALMEGDEAVQFIEKEPASETETEETHNEKEVKDRMTLAELKEKHPEIVAALTEELKASMKAEFDASLKTKEGEFTTKFAEMQAKVDSVTEENKKMQKAETIRREKERTALIEALWAGKLSESEIPDRLYAKVKSQIDPEKFVKDGELDVEGFKKAVDDEIKTWVEAGVKTSILGKGFSDKEVDAEKQTEAADKKWVDEMKARAGSATK